jgi:hypothetical protein
METNDTARIEAFSDGVFAIAITLLVLDLKVPRDLAGGRSLAQVLLAQWPAYLTFVTSFMTILVMWVNTIASSPWSGDPATVSCSTGMAPRGACSRSASRSSASPPASS